MDMVMLDEIIAAYKSEFERIDKEERYKWEAVKCFQDNWDIDAENFTAMLKKSLSKRTKKTNQLIFIACFVFDTLFANFLVCDK